MGILLCKMCDISFICSEKIVEKRKSTIINEQEVYLIVFDNFCNVMKNAPGGNRTHNYSLGENCYIHLTTGTKSITLFDVEKRK